MPVNAAFPVTQSQKDQPEANKDEDEWQRAQHYNPISAGRQRLYAPAWNSEPRDSVEGCQERPEMAAPPPQKGETLDRGAPACIFIHMLRDTTVQNTITAKALPTGSGPGR